MSKKRTSQELVRDAQDALAVLTRKFDSDERLAAYLEIDPQRLANLRRDMSSTWAPVLIEKAEILQMEDNFGQSAILAAMQALDSIRKTRTLSEAQYEAEKCKERLQTSYLAKFGALS